MSQFKKNKNVILIKHITQYDTNDTTHHIMQFNRT